MAHHHPDETRPLPGCTERNDTSARHTRSEFASGPATHRQPLRDACGRYGAQMDCYACGWNSRLANAPPRESVVTENGWRVALAIGCSLPGWLVVVPTRHIQSMDELTDDESTHLGPMLRRLTRALGEVVNCQKTYVALFAEQEGFSHLHMHVVPRMPWFSTEQTGPRSLAAFLGKPVEEATSESDRDAFAIRLREALA